MEDGAVDQEAEVVGGKLAWHQDYAYWPLATPGAVTCWIALDDVGAENGGMQVARRARTSSARSCRSSSATAARSCTTSARASARCTTPEEAGLEVGRLPAEGRRVRLPPRADLARVGPEHEPRTPGAASSRATSPAGRVARRAALPLQLHRRGARAARPASRSAARTSRRSRPPSEGPGCRRRVTHPVTRRQ